ncbi:MAG TPA: CoB--CoM heterodisulfide reductase iron-sulfur subunit B family protein [Methanothrix sp.]|nr:CoB--CoM heterodisulfide reductase iron-sulfur subunit B family protein [Methanothrix sp.]HPT19316.1 CoB--CoM heterodisulfide reductase iron-sulfur subunit B family protein [Methanothrix sp.]
MKLAYYPGCVSASTGKEMDASTRAVCAALSIELEELDDWNCCGATHVSNELVATGLSARNMAMTDLPIMTACSICYSNLRSAAERLREAETLDKVNALLDKKYSGATIRHALDVILEALAEKDERIVLPLRDLKVAPYYGCLLTRPRGVDSPEFPTLIEKLIRRLSAQPVDFPFKTLCCGGPIFMPRQEAAEEIAFKILSEAKRAGAEVIVTVCPLCHLMLDAKQKAIEQRRGEQIGIPVLYVTQLAGIALGLGPEELGLFMNSVSPLPLVEKAYERMTETE